MRMLQLVSLLTVAAGLMLGMPARAATVADTGTPPGTGLPLGLDATQWLAGQVTVASATVLDTISAFVNDQGGRGSFTVALYTDSPGHLPGTLINSWSASFITASNAGGWNGVSGINQSVSSGTYWVAFEVQGSDSFAGVVPVTPPSPLVNYAFNPGSGYVAMADSFGVQVTAVPEPEVIAMLLAGLILVQRSAARKPRPA